MANNVTADTMACAGRSRIQRKMFIVIPPLLPGTFENLKGTRERRGSGTVVHGVFEELLIGCIGRSPGSSTLTLTFQDAFEFSDMLALFGREFFGERFQLHV
jgi:hypothetical protein